MNENRAADDLELQRSLSGAEQAHRELAVTVAALPDDEFVRPSLLPGWSIAHVLAHISRNADSHTRLLAGAQRGEVADQYPGGLEGRADEIAAVAALSPAEVRADLHRACAELEQMWTTATDGGWVGEGRVTMGPVIPVTELPIRRWREVVVHHHDLGLAYTWEQWPADFVRLDLRRFTMQWASRKPMGFADLPAEVLAVPDNLRLAWLLGRSEIDGVGPAGLMG